MNDCCMLMNNDDCTFLKFCIRVSRTTITHDKAHVHATSPFASLPAAELGQSVQTSLFLQERGWMRVCCAGDGGAPGAVVMKSSAEMAVFIVRWGLRVPAAASAPPPAFRGLLLLQIVSLSLCPHLISDGLEVRALKMSRRCAATSSRTPATACCTRARRAPPPESSGPPPRLRA